MRLRLLSWPAAIVAFSLLAGGCASLPPVEPVDVAEPTPEMQHLTVHTEVTVDVDPPPAHTTPHYHEHDDGAEEVGAEHYDHQAQHEADAEALANMWTHEIEAQLADADVGVVSDGTRESVIELNVHVAPAADAAAHTSASMAVNMRWQVEMIHDGKAVDSGLWTAPLYVSSEGFDSSRKARQTHHESLAARVVNELFESPRIAQIAGQHAPEKTQAVASAEDEPISVVPDATDHLTAAPQPNAHALVIGIEDYRDLTPTPGARVDAERFAHMLETTLGVPDQNIHLMTDNNATRGDIVSQLLALQEEVPSDGRIYFFFSGHGTPDVQSGESHLLPYEGQPETLDQTGLAMEDVLSNLEQTRAREVLAFVDACFSGSGERSSLPEGTRPVVPVQETDPTPNVALFSSSGASEISGTAPDADEGLFTRHVINAIARGQADIDGDGQISLDELHTYVTPRVSREARQLNRDQTPVLDVSQQLGDPSDVILVWGLPRD